MNETRNETKPAAGTTSREDFGGRELVVQGETAVSTAAARAKATVEARFIVAMKRPRDNDQARFELVKECKRLSFAEAALYYKPIGATKEHFRALDDAKAGNHEAKAWLLLGTTGGVRGASIRLIEAALRALTNIQTTVSTVFEDEERRIIRVEVTDLQANVSVDQEFVIAKTIERAKCPDDVEPLYTRTNARGKKVFVLEADEDQIATKVAAAVSKAIRTQGKRLIPADLLEEAEAQARLTLELGAKAEDPDKARKEIADAFAGLGVTPVMLKEFLGHELASCSPAERIELRLLFRAIKAGDTTFSAALADRRAGEPGRKPAGEPSPPTVEGTATPSASPGAAAPAPAPSSASRAKTADEIKAELRAKAQGGKP